MEGGFKERTFEIQIHVVSPQGIIKKMAKRTCLMIGGSGMAGGWINNFTNNFSDRIEIVGLADVSTDVLTAQGEALGLGTLATFHRL